MKIIDFGEWKAEMVNAGYDGSKIQIRRDARHIEILEELLHSMQDRITAKARLNQEALPHWEPYPIYEIHVKDFMIRHRRILKITDEDAEVLRQMIIRQMESRADIYGNPLVLPASGMRKIGD